MPPPKVIKPERFQLQLYTELLRLLENRHNYRRISRSLEISCGRGGGLGHLARHLPRQAKVIGLDYSAHAIAFCQKHFGALANFAFVRGHALHLPFKDGSFDLVVNVEASHAYGDDAAFLREVRRVLHPQGRFLYADYRTRRKVACLEQMASTAGLTGELRDITNNVVSACELDAERRRRIIRGGLPWYCRPIFAEQPRRLLGPAGNAEFRALSRRRQNVLPDLHEASGVAVSAACAGGVLCWRAASPWMYMLA